MQACLPAADADQTRITCTSSCSFILIYAVLARPTDGTSCPVVFRLTSSFLVLASVCIMDIFNVQVQFTHSITRNDEQLQTNCEQQVDCSLSLSNKLNLIICRCRRDDAGTRRTGLAVNSLRLE